MKRLPTRGRGKRALGTLMLGLVIACGSDSTASNEPPKISSISPATEEAGAPGFTLVVTGSDFRSDSYIRWGSVEKNSTNNGSTSLSGSISAEDLRTAGPVNVTVVNRSGGLSSSSASFMITTAQLAALQVQALAAPVIVRQTAQMRATARSRHGVDLTAEKAACIQWSVSDANAATISPAGLLTGVRAGNPTVTAACEGVSANTQIQVVNPLPVIAAVTPSTIDAGSAALMLTVTGTDFVTTSQVRWNGEARQTTFISPTELRASIAAQDIAGASQAIISVISPPPGGGTSGSRTLQVNEISVGIFSETLPLYQPDTHTFVGLFSGAATIDLRADTSDKMEGERSLLMTVSAAATGFAGWFVSWGDSTRTGDNDFIVDMNAYSGGSLRFWLRSPVEVNVGIRSGDVQAGSEQSKVNLRAAGYALSNEQWQRICIPIRALADGGRANLARVKVLFVIAVSPETGGTGGISRQIRVDDVRWDKRPC